MRSAYRCHLDPRSAVASANKIPNRGGSPRWDPSEVIGVARCPCCRTPLIARMGRQGPYFYCGCYEGLDRFGKRVELAGFEPATS